jgi:ADP-ribose pyrophosphatase
MTLDRLFTRKDVLIKEDKSVYRGYFGIRKFLLSHRLFSGKTSALFTRELFTRGQSVGVLLYDPWCNRVGLVKQFRIGCLDNVHGPWVWEVIAGVNDRRESPEQVALREILEESGHQLCPEQLIPVLDYYASPGGSDEHMYLFCAIAHLDMEEHLNGLSDEHEDILFKVFAYEEAIGAMLSGLVNNAATVISLQWLQLNKTLLQEKFCNNSLSKA